MKKLFVFAIATMFAFSMSAQKFGVKAGMNMSGYTTNYNPDEDSKMGMGFNVGLLGEYAISDKMGVRAGLTYNQLGSDSYSSTTVANVTSVSDFKTDVSYLMFNVAPKFNFGPAYAFVGPYFGYALSAKYNGTYTVGETVAMEVKDLDLFGEPKDGGKGDFLKKTDFGLNLGLGAEFSGVIVEFNLGYGMANFYNKDTDTYKTITAGADAVNALGVDVTDEMFPYVKDKKAVGTPKVKNIFFGLSVGYMLGGE